jgi:hypothetical protein
MEPSPEEEADHESSNAVLRLKGLLRSRARRAAAQASARGNLSRRRAAGRGPPVRGWRAYLRGMSAKEICAALSIGLLGTAACFTPSSSAQAQGAPGPQVQPPSPPPGAPPPPPPSQVAAPWAGDQAPPPPATGTPDGQWVYTQQYGWVWMAYDDLYTWAPPNGSGEPLEYVYYPSYGWEWVAAPWVWGIGPWPYFGRPAPNRFAWYQHGWWRSPRRWHYAEAPHRGALGERGIRPAPPGRPAPAPSARRPGEPERRQGRAEPERRGRDRGEGAERRGDDRERERRE